MKDPVMACAIAVAGAMIMVSVRQVAPHIYWGILITLLIYMFQRLLKQNGFSWTMWNKK
jgi:lipopolysaccharide export LptBFGC system permease protein LptF